jgi:hypothetical protein
MKKIIEKKQMFVFFIYLLIFSGFLFAGYTSTNKDIGKPEIIDLIKVIQNERDVPLSQFVTTLEYVPLELTPEAGISYIRKIYLTDNFIIVRHDSPGSANPLLLFDRKSGKFIRQLGKKGRGPEEFTIPFDCFYNPFDKKIYTYGSMKSSVKTYNLDGKYLETIITPVINESSINKNLPVDAFIDSETYAGYISNSTGQVRTRLVMFSRKEVIASFPNFEKWSSDQVAIGQDPLFFKWENQVSFKERSNDTVFCISGANLIPRYVLNSGNYRYPYHFSREEAIEQMTKPKDYFETSNIFENSNYLFFDLATKNKPIENNPSSFIMVHNLCIFDKSTKSTVACKVDVNNNSGLADDINNFMAISPLSITDNNELVAVLEATKIIKWKKENQAKFVELKAKLPWLDKINELDNPVVVIAKCKK